LAIQMLAAAHIWVRCSRLVLQAPCSGGWGAGLFLGVGAEMEAVEMQAAGSRWQRMAPRERGGVGGGCLGGVGGGCLDPLHLQRENPLQQGQLERSSRSTTSTSFSILAKMPWPGSRVSANWAQLPWPGSRVSANWGSRSLWSQTRRRRRRVLGKAV